jgi:hypothetical protein
MTAEASLTWPQVLAWRMGRSLLDPLGNPSVLDIVRRLCGVQAQVPAAAALAVGVRQADPVPDGMDQALQAGDVMRTWAMRGTLHLLPPDDAGAYLALMAAGRGWERASWVKTFGVTPEQMVQLTETVADVLDDQVLTRDELVTAVGERLGHSDLEAELRSGWGAVLKPVAWQGALCHAPTDGNRVAFARPDRLLPTWQGLPSPDEAAAVVIPAYLRTYGPATPERFDTWLSRATTKKATLRGWFAALDDQLVTVEVEGTSGYVLAEDLDDLMSTAPTLQVCLLPAFDHYVLGPGTAATEIIAPERRKAISRTAGWIAPVIIAAGRVAGTWDPDKHDPTQLTFDLFDDVTVPAEAIARLTHVQAALS